MDNIPFWWGQLDELVMVVDGYNITYSLKNVVNSVSVFYTELNAGESGTGTPKETTPVVNQDSINRYGLREKKFTLSNVSAAAADLKAAYELELNKQPKLTPTVISSGVNGTGTFRATGLFALTQNEYYQNTNTNEVDSVAQIQQVLAFSSILNGGFVEGSFLGVLTNEYRDGKTTSYSVMKKLFDLGTDSNLPMVITTGVGGFSHIREGTGTEITDFILYPTGELVAKQASKPVGTPHSVLGGYVEILVPSVRINTQKQIIDKIKLDVVNNKYTYSLLGQTSPFNFNLIGVG